MLSHLVYISRLTPKCTDSEIEKILASSRKNNPELEVTGVLLYSDTHFLQYIEGDYKKLIALYDKIKEDDRHKNAVMLANGPIKERSFPSWQMGSKKVNEKEIQLKSEMSEEDKRNFLALFSDEQSENTRAREIIERFFK